ncbi:MAG: hypothetical protein SH848_21875 [Saprospiraceae bacterium]|nr:hypothetical protein [Saprospiraceae bacterium]MDZ4706593.1 hypothetical protein [Saprospiraceae bacterium]
MVNEYTPEGKCFLPSTATGLLTVQTADLSPTESIPTGKRPFQVAIRNKEFNTLRMFTQRTYREIDLKKVLAKCQKGDHIVLLMLEEGYALRRAGIGQRLLQPAGDLRTCQNAACATPGLDHRLFACGDGFWKLAVGATRRCSARCFVGHRSC